jgi:hypothetical protein
MLTTVIDDRAGVFQEVIDYNAGKFFCNLLNSNKRIRIDFDSRQHHETLPACPNAFQPIASPDE